MKTTKKVFISKNVNALADAAGIGKSDPVPAVGAPPTPKDFVPVKWKRGTKVQPPAAVVKAASGAAKELGNSTTYAKDFSASAPDAATLAKTVAFAAAWSGQYALASKWLAYVKEQTRLAWLQANPQLDDFAPAFAYARDRNEDVGTEYASTAKVFDARAEGAVKGAAVKASKRAASGKGARSAKGSATPAASAAESPAGGASLPAPVAPTPEANGASAKN